MDYEKQYQKYKTKYLNLKYNKIGGKDQNIKYIGEFKDILCTIPAENKNCYKFEGIALDENNNKIGNPNMEGFWETKKTYSTGKKEISFLNNNGEINNYSWKSDEIWHTPTPDELHNIKDYTPTDNPKIIYGIFNKDPKYKQDEEADKKKNDNKIRARSFFTKIRRNIEKSKEDNIIKEKEKAEKLKKLQDYTEDINKKIAEIEKYIKNDNNYSDTELSILITYLNKSLLYYISDIYAFFILKEKINKVKFFNNLIDTTSQKYLESIEKSTSSGNTPLQYLYIQGTELFKNSKNFKNIIQYTNTPFLYIITEVEKIINNNLTFKVDQLKNNKLPYNIVIPIIQNILNILEYKINYTICYIENTVDIHKDYLIRIFYYSENIINLLNSFLTISEYIDVKNSTKYRTIKTNIELNIIKKILDYLYINNIKLSEDKQRILFTHDNHDELINKLKDYSTQLKTCLGNNTDDTVLKKCMDTFNKILPELEYKINNDSMMSE